MMNNTITRLQPLDVDVPLSLKARLVAIPFLLALLPAQSAWAQDATIEYPEKSMHPVRTFVATDPEGAVVPSWSLSGVDAEDFSIEDGVLSFKSPPNFEKAGDADQNNIYSVNVVASDGANSSKENVMVEVTDVEEAGTITLSALKPQAGTRSPLSFPILTVVTPKPFGSGPSPPPRTAAIPTSPPMPGAPSTSRLTTTTFTT